MGFRGTSGEMAKLRKGVADLKRQALAEVVGAVLAATMTATQRTPVWEGETIRNYRWGRNGQRPAGTLPALGSGDPGPTNEMGTPPAGEPRRAVNESAALADALSTAHKTKLMNYVMVNTIDAKKWDIIDSGIAPGGFAQNQRGPGGYMKLAEQTVRNRRHWK